MDTTGLLLAVVVHAANIQDRDGAKLVLSKLLTRFPRLQLIWADAAYAGGVGLGRWGMGIERGAAQSRQPSLRGTASPVGGGAHLGVVEPLPTAQQGFRGTAGNQRGMGSYSDGPPDAQETQTSLTSISHTPSKTRMPSAMWR